MGQGKRREKNGERGNKEERGRDQSWEHGLGAGHVSEGPACVQSGAECEDRSLV